MSRLNKIYVEDPVPRKEFMSGIHEKYVQESIPEEFMSAFHEKDVKESIPVDFMSAIHEKDAKESAPNKKPVPERELGALIDLMGALMDFVSAIHEKDAKESVPNKKTVPERDLGALIDLMRGVKSEPGEYYYDVMQNAKDVSSFVQSRIDCLIGTRTFAAVESKGHLLVDGVDYNPKAFYIVVELGTHLDSDDLYGGYAIEIFSEDGFYSVTDIAMDITSEMWKIVIPKKKGGRTRSVEGNLIFFRNKKYAN